MGDAGHGPYGKPLLAEALGRIPQHVSVPTMGPRTHEVPGWHHGGDTHGRQADRRSGAPHPILRTLKKPHHRPPRAWGNEHCPGPLLPVDTIWATALSHTLAHCQVENSGRLTRMLSGPADLFGTEPVVTTATTKLEGKEQSTHTSRKRQSTQMGGHSRARHQRRYFRTITQSRRLAPPRARLIA